MLATYTVPDTASTLSLWEVSTQEAIAMQRCSCTLQSTWHDLQCPTRNEAHPWQNKLEVLCPHPQQEFVPCFCTGPPPSVSTPNVTEIVRVNGDQWEFNLTWVGDCDLEYVITADPPLPPSDQCMRTVDCATQCRLGLDTAHNLTVTPQNCGGTQNGTESDPIQVCFERKSKL